MRHRERMWQTYEKQRAAGGPVDILAIESSCDETAAAVVQNGRIVLSSVVASQMESHQRFGGVVPEVAARAHVEQITRVIDQALIQAGRSLTTLQAIAVTSAPGLVGALFIGVTAAKSLAQVAGLPLIGVHHLAGHVYAAALSGAAEVDGAVEPPFLALVVSGGHTELLQFAEDGVIFRLGRTRDDAAGEAFDKIARALALGYPGGPVIQALALQGDPAAIAFPRAKLEPGSLDFSFSGLKSAVLLHMDKERKAGRPLRTADIAAGFQSAVTSALVEKTAAALAQTKLQTLVLAGGVAANQELRERLAALCAESGVRLIVPDFWLCTDNAAMIGAAAYDRYRQGRFADLDLTGQANLAIDRW